MISMHPTAVDTMVRELPRSFFKNLIIINLLNFILPTLKSSTWSHEN